MKFLQFLMISAMTLAMAGCCACHNCCVDPCDSCSTGPVIGGGILRFFSMPNCSSGCCDGGCGGGCDGEFVTGCGNCCGGCGGCHRGCLLSRLFSCHGCRRSCCNSCDSCCEMMDGGCCGGNCGGNYDYSPTPMYSYGQQPTTTGPVPQTMPANPGSTAPVPNAIPETNPAVAPPPPANEPQTNSMNSMRPGPQTQMVSYEEFQRLPGTVISGPGVMPGAQSMATTNVIGPAPTTNMMTSTPQVSGSMPRPVGRLGNQMARTSGPASAYTRRPMTRSNSNAVYQASATTTNQQPVWVPAKAN